MQLVKKFPAFHGTGRFITALTSVRQLSLSWASPIQSIYPHPTSWISILILFTHLRLGLPSGFVPSGFLTKTLYAPSPHPYAPHAQPVSFFSILSPAQYWVRSTNHLAPRYAISSIPPLTRPSYENVPVISQKYLAVCALRHHYQFNSCCHESTTVAVAKCVSARGERSKNMVVVRWISSLKPNHSRNVQTLHKSWLHPNL